MAQFGKEPKKSKRGGPRPGSGRPKGKRTKGKLEAIAFASSVIDDPAYLDTVRTRALDGSLPTPLEILLWHYKAGKPVERIEHSGTLAMSLASVVAGTAKKDGNG